MRSTCHESNTPPVRWSCLYSSHSPHRKTHTHARTHLLPRPCDLVIWGESALFCGLRLTPGTRLGPSPVARGTRAAVYPLWWVQPGWSSHIKWISRSLVLQSGAPEDLARRHLFSHQNVAVKSRKKTKKHELCATRNERLRPIQTRGYCWWLHRNDGDARLQTKPSESISLI